MQTKPNCPKCSSSKISKNGMVKGVQRYKCKECHFQFTRTTPRGRSAADKALAVTLYLMGVSMNAIGRLLKVSTPAVLGFVGICVFRELIEKGCFPLNILTLPMRFKNGNTPYIEEAI